MIDLLKADLCRLRRWKIFYFWLLLITGADLLYEAVKRLILHRQFSFLPLMISGLEQKILFVLVGAFVIYDLYLERESGFFIQTQPLYPKWKQTAEKLVFGGIFSFAVQLFFFLEHLGKAVYLQINWTGTELIEAEAFFVGNIFVCAAFVAAGICLVEWMRNIWVCVAVLTLLVWGLPLHLAFEKMLSVFGGEGILSYGMYDSFSNFCGKIWEGSFLQMIVISCIWVLGFGGFAFLGKLRR